MAQTIRSFVAVHVDCGPELRRVLRELNGMGGAMRAMSPDHLHVTLKFLGDVPLEQTAAISGAIAESVRDVPAFTADLRGLGAFPHLDRPTVVWAGYAEPGLMSQLADQVEIGLNPMGFPREQRPFHPHATLARVKSRPPDSLRQLVEQHAATSFGPTEVESVELYQSELNRDGPRYTVLSRAPLRG
jgi:2'-5' RNA ligase